MSRYAYGYSVAPARPTGWRSALGNFVGVSAMVTLSVISGAVVAYELIGGDFRALSTSVSSAAVAPAAATTGAAPAVQPVATLAAAESPKPAPRIEAPAVVATVTAAPVAAPKAAPAAATPAAPVARNEDVAPPARDDLTFAKGYALRRAARQAAATQAAKAPAAQTATANAQVAAAADAPGTDIEKQLGRPAAAAKRKPTAMAQYPRGERYGMFERFEGPRHQALAFGDSSPRPVRRSGGWFDGLF